MSSTATTESMRYQKLLDVIDKALKESRKSFDTSAAIQECYGDDASIFGAATLAKLLDSVLDRVNENAKQQVVENMETNGVELKLKQVEQLICTIQQQAAEKKEAEAMDRLSATNALEKAKLPEGILPADIVSHRAYAIMKKERDALDEQLCKMEEETKVMEEQIAMAEKAVKQRLGKVEETGAKLEQTADACSFVS